jgi:hypothetical protein
MLRKESDMNYMSQAHLRLLLSVVVAIGCATASINGTLGALVLGSAGIAIHSITA